MCGRRRVCPVAGEAASGKEPAPAAANKGEKN